MIVNWLLTRKCNRRCSYCGIVSDPKNAKLSRISEINNNEMTFETIVDSIHGMNMVYNPNTLFHIFYGGEPFLKPGFSDFINTINRDMPNVNYTVITNGSLRNNIVECFQKAGKFKGLTVSLDPMIMESDNVFNDIKNNNGFEVLKMNQEMGLTDDMVVECVLDKRNIKYSSDFLNFMHEHFPEVSISISVYDFPKNEEYDFALNDLATKEYIDSMRLYPLEKHTHEAFTDIHDFASKLGYNIHLGNSKEFLNKIQVACDSTYMCKICHSDNDKYEAPKFKTLTIDADGRFRLCLRIAGRPRINVRDVFGNFKNDIRCEETIIKRANVLKDDLLSNYNEYCKGCAWTCPMMDEHWKDPTDVAHGQVGSKTKF